MKAHFSLRLMATAAAVGSGLVAVPACAADQQPAASQPAQAGDSTTIPDIIVTATRQSVDKQKLGVALTALTADQLAVLAPHTLQDIQGSAPNVFIGIATAAPGQSAIFIRGQGYADV